MIFPARKTDLLWREVEDEVVVLDQDGGKVHQFNETAAFIWKWCDGSRSLTDISGMIAREYAVPESQVGPDVASVVDRLCVLGLLELLPEPKGSQE